MTSTLTLDTLRADTAAILGEDLTAIDVDANLMDLGLDSMRAMTLVSQWVDNGAPIDFGDLITAPPTLAGWWEVINARLQDA